MLATLFASFLLGGPKFDFYSHGPYTGGIPKPESILGYGPGEQHTTFRDQEKVVLGIVEAAKGRAKLIEYGKSTQGRPLKIIAISSPQNIAKLEEIRKQHADLAQGKGDASKTVPIVWINECIHGDETASFESAMWTLYNLTASKGEIAKQLENCVVILNPVYNPDGHERYVVFYNAIAQGSGDQDAFERSVPGVARGRENHYRFDMNRDRVSFSQQETRFEFAEMLRWGPQVYIDQHGQVSSYFMPPEPMSINPNVDRARNNKWTEIIGRATAKAFEANGLTYFIKDSFDLFYPGYLDASATLSGAIGMTHETDGGRTLKSDRRDGSTLTLTQGMFKHFTSALAVVKASSENGPALLADYAKFKRDAVSGRAAGTFRTCIVRHEDPRPLIRLQDQLSRAGIVSTLTNDEMKLTKAHDYWSDATGQADIKGWKLVVDMAQPQGMMAKALLEPTTEFEAEFVKNQLAKKKTAPEGEDYPGPDGVEFYDTTAWSLPYAHCLDAWWTPEVITPEAAVPLMPNKPKTSTIGYFVRYTDQEDMLAIHDMLVAGVRVQVNTKPMKLEGGDYPVGTFMIMADRNEDGYEKKVFDIGIQHGCKVERIISAYPEFDRHSPGDETVASLRKPKIAVVMGSTGSFAESGAIWYLMDKEFKLPFTPINASALNGDLSRFTTIVIPAGASVPTSGKLREWISAGGSLVAFGGSSGVGESGFVKLESTKGELQDMPGSLVRVEMDKRSFLNYGYNRTTLAWPVSGSRYFLARKEGGSMATVPTDEKKDNVLSGWKWPDETEKALRGTVWLQDAPVGRGHATLFFSDPTERAMWPGLYKAMLNGMFLGNLD